MKMTTMQENILITAEGLIQKVGYNAFSYKDIAQVVGIKTSSIHYYYPTKEDLAIAVIDWQLNKISLVLNELKFNTSLTLDQKLLSFVDTVMSLTFKNEKKMCLGGMLASDVFSLSEKLKIKICSFFDVLDNWISDVLQDQPIDERSHKLQFSQFSRDILVLLEGGLLLSRLYEDDSYMEAVKQYIKRTV